MKVVSVIIAFVVGLQSTGIAQNQSIENEKFVFLNNGVTVGMIIKSVLKADTQKLKLTELQLPKARQIITNATVKYNEGVKKLKKVGLTNQKLRTLAVAVETEKLYEYKAILTSQQYATLLAQHKKTYPESKV